ncbi:MAG: glycosyltransferase [Bacteroidales bacterium]|nr:glycosyltransferase [Bacteroidales bacterium]
MISVALCTYNGERYIREQLQSIFDQSMPVDEVVIGDDGSSDATLDIIGSFKDKLPIRILDCNQQRGAIKNFLHTISECQGDFIFLSDQDDVWRPNKVENIIQYFNTHSQIDAVFTDATLIDSEGKPLEGNYTLWDYFFDEISRKRCDMGLMIEEFCASAHATGATMAFRKRLTDRFPNRDDVWHDELIARLAVASHSLAYLPEQLTCYRIHDSQQIGISPHGPKDGLERDYRLPEMPYSIEDLFLTNEEDIRHIYFLEFRCQLKHQVLGWANAIMHLSLYRKIYHRHALAFALYDMKSSFRHTVRRIVNKFKP